MDLKMFIVSTLTNITYINEHISLNIVQMTTDYCSFLAVVEGSYLSRLYITFI